MTDIQVIEPAKTATEAWHALVVGIDRYPHLGPGVELGGCVHDAVAVWRFLVERVRVPAAQARLLVSARSDEALAGVPPEAVQPADARTVRAAFEALERSAAPGAHVVLYYAGHGVLVHQRETGERFYGFAASDAALADHGYDNLILDRLLNAFLRALTARGTTVSVIADTCHSGGATRGATRSHGAAPTARQLPSVILTREEWASFSAQYPEAGVAPPTAAAARGSAIRGGAIRGGPTRGGATRNGIPRDGIPRGAAIRGGWLDGGPEGAWVALSACSDVETAKEVTVGSLRRGLFTASLLHELEGVSPGELPALRWLDFFPRLARSVANRAHELHVSAQTPLLEGRAERTVFGGAWTPAEPGFRVSRGSGDGAIDLDGGKMDGLDEGVRIRLYPPEIVDIADAEARGLPCVEAIVEAATLVTSTARLVNLGAAVGEGFRAHARGPRAERLRMGVVLAGLPGGVVEAILATPEASERLALDPARGRRDVQVIPWARGESARAGWALVPYAADRRDPSPDEVIAYLSAQTRSGAERSPAALGEALGRGLVHWARYLEILGRSNAVPALAALLEVGLRAGDDASVTPEAAECPRRVPGPSGFYEIEEDEALWVEAHVSAARPMWVGVVLCSNDGSAIRVWPPPGARPSIGGPGDEADALHAGQTVRVGCDRFHPVRLKVRDDQESSLYTFKIIAAALSSGAPPPSLHGFVLPGTVQEALDGAQRTTRGGFREPRGGFRVPEPAPEGWCAFHLPVRVRRAPGGARPARRWRPTPMLR